MSERPLVAVLDYGIGNLRSAEKSLARVGADAHLTADRGLIADAAGVVLPGVGAFGRCMEELRVSGLDQVAVDAVKEGRPFLGICIGMQLLYRASEEAPDCPGLGVIDAEVVRMSDRQRLPQMQWNVLHGPRGTGSPSHEMFAGLDDRPGCTSCTRTRRPGPTRWWPPVTTAGRWPQPWPVADSGPRSSTPRSRAGTD